MAISSSRDLFHRRRHQIRRRHRWRHRRSLRALREGISDAARSHRRRRADKARRGRRAAFAGPCARCDQLAAADPVAGKDHLHRRQLSGSQRRVQGRPGRAEISEHVHAHAALLCRPQRAAGPPARLRAARLRGRAGARHRQGRPAHQGERRRWITSPRSRCATKAPSATGCGTPNSTSRRARISIPPAASGRGSCPTPMKARSPTSA